MTEKPKGYSLATTPTHLHKHLLELNGFSFKGKKHGHWEAKS